MVLGRINRIAWGTKLLLMAVWASLVNCISLYHLLKTQYCSLSPNGYFSLTSAFHRFPPLPTRPCLPSPTPFPFTHPPPPPTPLLTHPRLSSPTPTSPHPSPTHPPLIYLIRDITGNEKTISKTSNI